MSGREAASIGLVTRTARDGQLFPSLESWLAEAFLPRSAAGLRFAALASRPRVRRAIEEDLPALERLYLEQLMREPDAVEGIHAFLEKRQPRWSHNVHSTPDAVREVTA
jgi:enoyl-CoA hydratase/carnithine racemase